MEPSQRGHTVIYTPQAHDFFCVEPVSHMPNAVNRPEPADITGLRSLAPGEAMALECRFEVRGF
jgi:aldose 1-epimerase